MQKYELVVVLDGKATAAKKKSFGETIEKLVSILKGKIEKVDEWGVKDLAFGIGKSTTGLYLLFHIELDAKSVKSLKDKVKMEAEVLRYLLVRKE